MVSSVRIGTNPIAWSNDDLRDLGGATPLETCLSEASAAGFQGIELGHKFPRQSDPLRQVLAQHNLALISGWYSSELLSRSVEEEINNLEPHLALLKSQGCDVVVWAETTRCIHGDRGAPLSMRPCMTEEEWTVFTERLSEIADYVRRRGLRLAYHHHMGTVIETVDEIDRLMQETSKDVGLLLDTGHLTFAGGDPLEVAERHISRIVHVHCKDVRVPVMKRMQAAGASFLDGVIEGVFTVPGDGDVNFLPVLEVLAAHKYKGWLVVEAEQDPAKANPLEYAKKGFLELYSMAGRAGL